MKRVEELGNSPMPWSWSEERNGMIVDANLHDVALVCYEMDWSIIKAAPKLYECLREAVIEMCNAYCEVHDGKCQKNDGECFVQKWRKALEKAGGAE